MKDEMGVDASGVEDMECQFPGNDKYRMYIIRKTLEPMAIQTSRGNPLERSLFLAEGIPVF